ncbi:rod shape-determining protein RodA [Treponema sp. J25]|uniref:rod shape-determining protein RodA n=1 Tax=Treponema sp. J25 TaxID=2094121 RepID=UPI00104B0246|nr:rod shape-determining protein RodA [Treponema sp. J25]TCW60195.1 rod shape-determining protein RodA [Treponema sp. J25]
MNVKRLGEMDFPLLLSAVALIILGVMFVFSAGVTSTGDIVSTEYIRQIIWAVLSIVVCLVLSLVDYRRIYDFVEYIYFFFLLLILYTAVFGKVVNGARAWLGIGSFGIQPSEFMKIATILYLAKYLDSSGREADETHRFIISALIIFVPVAIILLQPDLGTALVFIPIFLFMSYIAGIRLTYILYVAFFIAGTGILTVLPLWQSYILKSSYPFINALSNTKVDFLLIGLFAIICVLSIFGYLRYRKRYFYWIAYIFSGLAGSFLFSFIARHVLKEYQIMRLLVFLDPSIDPRGAGWNIIQSITAIGSGGILGKGFLQGTQSHYRYLPQQSTDFIFSIFSEEMGFIGGIVLFLLFLVILIRCTTLMKTTSDPFGSYVASGISAVIFFHFVINVGMAMGIMPITGIPLIFLSYGGSSLLATMIGIGILQSIYIRRFEH